MNEVAIDSSQSSSIALNCAEGVFRKNDINFGRASDSEFLPCLKAFLAEHGLGLRDVDGWTVGLGPGSFAGIRFALALVKGICTATGAKARGVNSSYAMATALARASQLKGRIAIIQNARCLKAFVSLYDSGDLSCKPVGEASMVDVVQPWPVEARADFYATPNEEMKELLPAEISAALTLIPSPDAACLLNANTEDWPCLDTPDVEPVYVRPAAGI